MVGATQHTVGSNQEQGAAYVFVQNGSTWNQQAELTSSDGARLDDFGTSVAVDGSTVVVGAPRHTVGSNQEQGAAYVFIESGGTWSQEPELTSSDGAAGDGFGNSVAVSGSSAVVGASYHPASPGRIGYNPGPGAAYVFGPPQVPAVTLSPTSLNFRKEPINSTTAPKVVTLQNTGTATLTISASLWMVPKITDSSPPARPLFVWRNQN